MKRVAILSFAIIILFSAGMWLIGGQKERQARADVAVLYSKLADPKTSHLERTDRYQRFVLGRVTSFEVIDCRYYWYLQIIRAKVAVARERGTDTETVLIHGSSGNIVSIEGYASKSLAGKSLKYDNDGQVTGVSP